MITIELAESPQDGRRNRSKAHGKGSKSHGNGAKCDTPSSPLWPKNVIFFVTIQLNAEKVL
jgi:hypothetical protein